MNWETIEGNWKRFAGKAREQWGRLTDDDLERIEGRREQLAGTLQARYGETREEVEARIDEWVHRLEDRSHCH